MRHQAFDAYRPYGHAVASHERWADSAPLPDNPAIIEHAPHSLDTLTLPRCHDSDIASPKSDLSFTPAVLP